MKFTLTNYGMFARDKVSKTKPETESKYRQPVSAGKSQNFTAPTHIKVQFDVVDMTPIGF